ncbi:hypothetical protein BASA60_004681 [Batrachochytrium salamandrivorans]|nr:hypothetical protein BASA60_004681 [Batrachochytrium salamandrivorans]
MPSKRPNRPSAPAPVAEALLETPAYAISAFGPLESTSATEAAAYLASVSPALDASRLVVFNTASGVHTADYTTPAGALCSHVAFGKLKEQLLVSLSLSTGSILIYSVSSGTLLLTLDNGHRAPVAGFVFHPTGRKGYSIGEDGLLVEWDLKKGRSSRTYQSKSKHLSKVAIDSKGMWLAVAANQIELISISSMTLAKTFSGHATSVIQLEFDSKSESIFSAARDDRFISQWSLESTGVLPKVYTVDSPVSFLAYSSKGFFLAQLTSGAVNIWKTTDKMDTAAPSSAKKQKNKPAVAHSADSVITLTHTDTASKSPVLIHNATFIWIVFKWSMEHICGHFLKLCRYNLWWLVPHFLFSRWPFTTDSGDIIPEISLARNPDPPFAKAGAKGAAPKSGAPINVLGSLDMVPVAESSPLYSGGNSKHVLPLESEDASTTLEDRVRALDASLSHDSKQGNTLGENGGSGNPATPNSTQRKQATPISVQQMLSQAIQSGDIQMLEKALEIQDKKMIFATVKRLSPTQVIALLDLIVVRLQRRPARAVFLIEWVRSVLILHSAYLLSVPNLSLRLGSLYRTLDTRHQALSKLTRLFGRLDLAVSQIDSRRTTPVEPDADAVVVYDDEDEGDGDEEEEDDESESDDEFDEDEVSEPAEGEDQLGFESDEESGSHGSANGEEHGHRNGMELDEGDSDED